MSYFKNEGQEGKTGPFWRWVLVGEGVRKGWRRINTVKVFMYENRTIENRTTQLIEIVLRKG
jgi:hypothetical protein